MHHKEYFLGNVQLQSGEILFDAKLAYETYGVLNHDKSNVVVIPTFYTGTHVRNESYFGPGRAIDPANFFIVSPNLFGNSLSTSPSNARQKGSTFPNITFYDNVVCQHRLLSEVFGIERVKLVMGWSMGACQAFQWGAQFPDKVEAILPFCGSAKTAPHNFVFLEGVKAALQADATFQAGDYEKQPIKGLKAFGRVYAGWAYSQTFFREGLFRKLGFETIEDLLKDWEQDHLTWDANDLLMKLWTWQQGDISANPLYNGNLDKALAAIQAKAIVMPCSHDLYFTVDDSALEVSSMKNAELRIINSPWGHCVASGNSVPAFHHALDAAINDLIG